MKLILITGMPGSGKTTAARYLAELGYRVVNLGDEVRRIAEERGLKPSRENLLKLAEELRRNGGRDAVARRCIEHIKAEGWERIAVDGIRSLEEVEAFREAFGDALLIAIHASPRTRFERLKIRGRLDDPKSWDEFYARDLEELRLGLGSAIALADIIIVNEGDLGELGREMKRYIKKLANYI